MAIKEFEWTAWRDEALEQLNTALTSALLLGFQREEGQLYLDANASDVGTRAVMSQMQDDEEQVISYASKSLEGSEQH